MDHNHFFILLTDFGFLGTSYRLNNQYIVRYYEGGISSVYVWEDENEGFVACFLIKKGRDLT